MYMDIITKDDSFPSITLKSGHSCISTSHGICVIIAGPLYWYVVGRSLWNMLLNINVIVIT